MFHLKDNFQANAPISQVPASWFNAVASFLNNLVGGYGVKINKNGSAPVVSIDTEVFADQTKKTSTKEYQQLETPSTDQVNSPSHHPMFGDSTNPIIGLVEDTWVAGREKGAKVFLPTDSWADGFERHTAWRLCEFDKQGRLRKIGEQSIRTSVEL